MKIEVSVLARWEKTGRIIPLALKLGDDRHEISRVLAIQPGHSLKDGGEGVRYTVEIEGRRSYLYYDGRWWVDAPEGYYEY